MFREEFLATSLISVDAMSFGNGCFRRENFIDTSYVIGQNRLSYMDMKSVFKIVAVSLFLAIGCFGLIPAAGTSEKVSAVETAGLASLYGTHCASCHGGDGRANTPKGRDTDADDLTTSKVQNMSAAKMTRIIKNGKGDMPAFGKRLTAAQITAIIRHVKAF